VFGTPAEKTVVQWLRGSGRPPLLSIIRGIYVVKEFPEIATDLKGV